MDTTPETLAADGSGARGGPLMRPFTGMCPAPGHAAEVAAPPYDVLSTEEARAYARDRPWSFLHVSKPEIDLPAGTPPQAPEAYARAAENMRRMLQAGVLVRDAAPCFYVYRAQSADHCQTGIVAGASIAAYRSGRIRRHELTRPSQEDDRVRQIEAVGAQTGPVMLVHRADPEVADILARAALTAPLAEVADAAGVRHALWRLDDAAAAARLAALFDAMDALYIADGHHRSAAATRVAAARRAAGAGGDAALDGFLAVSFPDDEVRILDYNRMVRDLGGATPQAFLAEIGKRFTIEPAEAMVRPAHPCMFGMYLAGRWYRLDLCGDAPPADDPAARLDVSILADRLLEPVLGIGDPRTDPRIAFVGGGRGLEELSRRVDSGDMAVAFALYPTAIADLFAVADCGGMMPPKSTWFEPKLADGLISYPLD